MHWESLTMLDKYNLKVNKENSMHVKSMLSAFEVWVRRNPRIRPAPKPDVALCGLGNISKARTSNAR